MVEVSRGTSRGNRKPECPQRKASATVLLKNSICSKAVIICLSVVVAASYYSIGGVRVLVAVPLIVGALFVATAANRFKFSSPGLDFYVFLVVFVYCLFLVARGSNFDIIMSMSIFFLLVYWPLLTSSRDWGEQSLEYFIGIYLVAASMVAASVVIQYIKYEFLNVEFLRVEHFGGGRIAFSSIWNDFSFLSLYLASAIPLAWSLKNIIWRYGTMSLLGMAALMTSARAGFVSLIIALAIYIMYVLIRALILAKIPREVLLAITLSIVGLLGAVSWYAYVSSRAFTLSGSGREAGFLNGLGFWFNNGLFGSYLDISRFTEVYGAAPHNFLIYLLVAGGLFLAAMMAVWFLLVAIKCIHCTTPVRLALLTVFVGANFIPSFFSIYFGAFLVSLATVNVYAAKRSNDAVR